MRKSGQHEQQLLNNFRITNVTYHASFSPHTSRKIRPRLSTHPPILEASRSPSSLAPTRHRRLLSAWRRDEDKHSYIPKKATLSSQPSCPYARLLDLETERLVTVAQIAISVPLSWDINLLVLPKRGFTLLQRSSTRFAFQASRHNVKILRNAKLFQERDLVSYLDKQRQDAPSQPYFPLTQKPWKNPSQSFSGKPKSSCNPGRTPLLCRLQLLKRQCDCGMSIISLCQQGERVGKDNTKTRRTPVVRLLIVNSGSASSDDDDDGGCSG